MATADTLRGVIRKRVYQHPMGVTMTPVLTVNIISYDIILCFTFSISCE